MISNFKNKIIYERKKVWSLQNHKTNRFRRFWKVKHIIISSVFLATKDSQEFAIKIIDKDKIVEENLLESIKKEIQHMKVIQHPYIVKLYEVMATHSKIILVIEYIEGGELFDYISKIEIIKNLKLTKDSTRKLRVNFSSKSSKPLITVTVSASSIEI